MLSKFLVILVSVLAILVSTEARLHGRRRLRREPTKRSILTKRKIKNRSNRRLITWEAWRKKTVYKAPKRLEWWLRMEIWYEWPPSWMGRSTFPCWSSKDERRWLGLLGWNGWPPSWRKGALFTDLPLSQPGWVSYHIQQTREFAMWREILLQKRRYAQKINGDG